MSIKSDKWIGTQIEEAVGLMWEEIWVAELKIGDCVRMKSGGPVMTVEAARNNGHFTFSYIHEGAMRSVVLPGDVMVLVESEVDAHRLPAAMSTLEERVAALEEKVNARGYDTRPMYEVHEAKINAIEAELEELKRSHSQLEATTKRLGESKKK